jgi:hypothetical protein
MTDKIQALVEQFTHDLKNAVMADVLAALGSTGVVSVPKAKAATAVKTANGSRPKGEKRPPAELAAITDRLGVAIKDTPGLRIEQLAVQMGCSTKELALPAKKLLADKTVSTKGRKRATKYFPKGR